MLGALYELELSEEGYTVILVKTVVQALEIVTSRPVDLIVTAMSGCDQEADAAEKNLIHGVNVPVIINTGYHLRMVRDYLSVRVAHVLKSSNLTELKEKIKILLAEREPTRTKKIGTYVPAGSRLPDRAGQNNNVVLTAEHCRPEYVHG